MAIPSGSGTGVLRTYRGEGINGNSAASLLDGVANHIYTIVSIHVSENAGADEVLTLYISSAGGAGTVSRFANRVALGAWSSYVHNDKIVVTGTEELIVYTADTSNLDIVITYIDQDWT